MQTIRLIMCLREAPARANLGTTDQKQLESASVIVFLLLLHPILSIPVCRVFPFLFLSISHLLLLYPHSLLPSFSTSRSRRWWGMIIRYLGLFQHEIKFTSFKINTVGLELHFCHVLLFPSSYQLPVFPAAPSAPMLRRLCGYV